MKKLLVIFCILLSFSSYGQYNITQGLGSDSTLVWSKGGLKLRPVIISYLDTGVANLQRIKQYPFSVIATFATNELWYRNATATAWVKFSSSSNSGTPPSVVNYIDATHISICNVNSCDTFTTTVNPQVITIVNDSTLIVCEFAGSCDTININPTPLIPTQKFVDSIYNLPAAKTDTLAYNKNGDSIHVKVYDRNCGLIDGGLVTYDSLLIFTVSPAIYILCSDGIRRTSINTNITLAAADPSNPRIDAIILDANGVNKITGTAASDPAAPNILPSQILLTYILVDAGATTPPVIVGCTNPDKTIFDENTGSPEWTPTATGVGVDFSDTDQPYHLLKDADVDAFLNGNSFTFTTPTAIAIRNYTTLKFAIRLRTVFNPNTSFQVSWVTSAGSATVNILDGTHGFNRKTIGSYQIITLGIPEFIAPNPGTALQLSIPATVSLRFTMVGSNAAGFYMDYIQLGGSCIVQPPVPPTQRDNSFGIVNTVSGSANSTQPTDILTVTGTGGTTVSIVNKTLTINSTSASPQNLRQTNFIGNITDVNMYGVSDESTRYYIGYGVLNDSTLQTTGDISQDASGAFIGFHNSSTTGGEVFSRATNQNISSNWAQLDMQAYKSGSDTVSSSGLVATAGSYQAAIAAQITNGSNGILITTSSYRSLPSLEMSSNYTSTSSVENVVKILRGTSGSAGNGIGQSMDFHLSSSTGVTRLSNQLITKFTIATDATRTSQISLTGVNSGTTQTLMSIDGNGAAIFYGAGIPTYTAKAITTTNYGFYGYASGVGTGVLGSADGNGGSGVYGTSDGANSVGVKATSVAGTAIISLTETGLSASFGATTSAANTVTEVLRVLKNTSGTATAGLGSSINYQHKTSDGSTSTIANKLISEWVTATTGAETSKFTITGINGGGAINALTINGGGAIGYTINTTSAGTNVLTANSASDQIATGTTSTWTLPTPTGNSGLTFYMKNRGSGTVTLNSNSGSEIYSTSAVASISILAGEAYILKCDGSFWNVQ